MKEYLSIILFFVFLTGCSQLSRDRFILNGEIENAGAEYVVLSYLRCPEGIYVHDTAVIANGIFSVSDTLCEPALAKLQIGDTIISFYIEPSKVMTLNFSRTNFTDIILNGSQTEEENKILRERTLQHTTLLDEAKIARRKIKEDMDIALVRDSSRYSWLSKEVNRINQEIDSLSYLIFETEQSFINDFPTSFISAHLLNHHISEGKLNLEKQKSVFNTFPGNIKDSYIGKSILEKVECQQNTASGSIAPDFETADIHGNLLTLSSFRDSSYVLLDFWASWNENCQASAALLNNLYDKYHHKDLEIISISNEEKEDEWKSAIERNGTGKWHHIINKEYLNDFPDKKSIQYKYRKARTITPVYMLIDKEGKIIKKWEGYSAEIGEEIQAVLDTIFNR